LKTTEAEVSQDTGNPSLDGWYYQGDVSVWAALDLVLVKRITNALQLEPASQEDLEAELDAPVVGSKADIGPSVLVVQAKLRRTGPWTPTDIKKLLEHGKRRESASKRLQNEAIRYVLVTSADVTGDAKSLLIEEDFLELPKAAELPTVLRKALQKNALGRLAILGLQTELRVSERIDRILTTPFCLPHGKLQSCKEFLRQEAFQRMRNGSPWLRTDLEAAIRQFGGHVASNQAEEYVKPTLWHQVYTQLMERNALVLTGPSGTGKTSMVFALYTALQNTIPNLAFVEVSAGPSEIKSKSGTGPTLFHIEDPWGKYEVARGTFPSPTDLEQLLCSANRHQMIVVTSRSDILSAAVPKTSYLRNWNITLEPDHYGEREFKRLYENRIRKLPSGALKTAAVNARAHVLRKLTTPFEVERFFGHLALGASPADKNDGEFMTRSLDATLNSSIEVEVSAMILARGDVHWAAIIWGLMKAWSGFSREDIPLIRPRLARLDSMFRDGLEDLVNFMVAGGTLRQHGRRVTYTHPRVELGLKSAMQEQPGATERALSCLLSALITLDTGKEARWTAAAANIVAAIKDASAQWDVEYADVQGKLDDWLREQLAKEAGDYAGLLKLSAIVASVDSTPGKIGKWLRPSGGGGGYFMHRWTPKNHPDHWYLQLHSDPLTHRVCEQFIRKVLPVETRSYSRAFVDNAVRLSNDLMLPYRDACLAVMDEERFILNSDVIAYGAMRYKDNREPLMREALVAAIARSKRATVRDEEEYWAGVDGHLSGAYWEYPEDEEGANAVCVVEEFISAVRDDSGWSALALDERSPQLLEFWIHKLESTPAEHITDDELLGVLAIAKDHSSEAEAWRLAHSHWRTALAAPLKVQLWSRHPNHSVRIAAGRCALVYAQSDLLLVTGRLASEGNITGVVELLFDLSIGSGQGPNGNGMQESFHDLVGQLDTAFGEVVSSWAEGERLQEARLSPHALQLVLGVVHKVKGVLQAQLCRIAAVNGTILRELINEILWDATDIERALLALRAAVAAELWEFVEPALHHPRADIREKAFRSLAAQGRYISPSAILELATDKGSRVRLALVEALATRSDMSDLAAVVMLCRDEWSEDIPNFDENVDCPIAVKAAKIVYGYGAIAPRFTATLLETAESHPDHDVRRIIFAALAVHGEDAARQRISELVFSRTDLWLAVDAASALGAAEEQLAPELIEQATSNWFITKAPAALAVTMAVVVGQSATSKSVREIATELSVSQRRRVLLVPLAEGASRRDEGLAGYVLDLLPPGHAAKSIFEASRPAKLPSSVFDDLGDDIRTINIALKRYREFVEKRSKVSSAT
jgi:hypothetical protein